MTKELKRIDAQERRRKRKENEGWDEESPLVKKKKKKKDKAVKVKKHIPVAKITERKDTYDDGTNFDNWQAMQRQTMQGQMGLGDQLMAQYNQYTQGIKPSIHPGNVHMPKSNGIYSIGNSGNKMIDLVDDILFNKLP